jgi:hypothetical protein
LAEVIAKAKTLEADIDAWLSLHRKETLSLSWPTRDYYNVVNIDYIFIYI